MHLFIIIPYRDRKEHLKIFLEKAIDKINVDYFDILVVNQNFEKPFNRAKLCNVGFDYSKNKADYFCFHDVDFIPINVDYSYPEKPIHLATDTTSGDYNFFEYYGGVVLFNKKDFLKINGFSNDFWGWGGEDDDLLKRVKHFGYNYEKRISAKWMLLEHEKFIDMQNDNYKKNFQKLHTIYDFNSDGLSSLNYKVNSIEKISENVNIINVNI